MAAPRAPGQTGRAHPLAQRRRSHRLCRCAPRRGAGPETPGGFTPALPPGVGCRVARPRPRAHLRQLRRRRLGGVLMAPVDALPRESWVNRLRHDGRTLASLVRPRLAGPSLADRLNGFYGPQAADYDRFRARLLHGRQALMDRLPVSDGDVWIDFGGGTAS